jgi:ech hydrogenase subunit D
MSRDHQFEIIRTDQLIGAVEQMRARRARLVQICATSLPHALELTYSFDLDGQLTNLRLEVGREETVPSITSLYWCAFLYENEMHDLFNLQVSDIAVDFKGTLYTTRVNFAFGGSLSKAANGGNVADTEKSAGVGATPASCVTGK